MLLRKFGEGGPVVHVARKQRVSQRPVARKISKEREAKEREYLLLAEKLRRRCKDDCRFFIENYVQIEDRDAPGLAVPFTLWPKQVEVLDLFLTRRLIIVLKARQLGLTWEALSYGAWRMVFTPGYAVNALSRSELEAKELARRLTFIMRHLPWWIAVEEKDAGPDYIGTTWEATTMSVTIRHYYIDGKRRKEYEPSTFTSLTSGPESGRSFTVNLVILDEWAFQQWAADIWAAAYPTINRPTGGQVIGLSSGKRGTHFERTWDDAVNSQNDFVPVFLPWWADPRRDEAWYEATKRALPVTPDSEKNYHTEAPATPEEAFMYSGNNVFNLEKVIERKKALEAKYRENPPLRGRLECDVNARGDPVAKTVRFVSDENGWLTVYEEPQPGVPYVIGGDIAEGGIDWSTGYVINNLTGKQVAMWRGHTDTDLYALEMFKLGHWYNEALVAIEVNFDRHPVKMLQRWGYYHQYKREKIDDISGKKEYKFGWVTSSMNRGPLIAGFVAVARDNLDCIVDLTTLGEMLTFVRNEDGKPEALAGKFDDCVLAGAIAYKARDQQAMTTKPSESFLVGGKIRKKDAVIEDDDDEDEAYEVPGFYGM